MDMETRLLRMPDIQELLRSFEQMNRERESAAAKRDPFKNKTTRVFDAGVSAAYRYWPAGKNGKGQKVMFCWSTHRNAAGFYLGWREVYMKNGTVKRDRWLARRIKNRCAAIAKRRAGIKDVECEEQT